MSEKQLPKWNREVRAAKILEVKEGGELVLEGGITVHEDPKWMNQNHPDVGMYYVTGDEDCLSCVAYDDEFEYHYTRVEKEHA